MQVCTKTNSTRPHTKVATRTRPMMSTPPMVGMPALPRCNSASLWTTAAERMGWPAFRATSALMTVGPSQRLPRKAVRQAMAARKVIDSKRRSTPMWSCQ